MKPGPGTATIWTIEDVRKAVTITQDDGKAIVTPLSGQTYRVARAKGPAAIPIQFILRELKAAHPDSRFIFKP